MKTNKNLISTALEKIIKLIEVFAKAKKNWIVENANSIFICIINSATIRINFVYKNGMENIDYANVLQPLKNNMENN